MKALVQKIGKRLAWGGVAAAVLAAFVAGYWIAAPGITEEKLALQGGPSAASAPAKAEVLYWTCSMHPQIRQPKPGKCPICAMDLIPVASGSQGQATSLRSLTVTPAARALMGVQTVPVERRFVTAEIRMVGKVDYDETRLAYITAWVPGRLDRLFVDYTGIPVRKGDHMVYIYSPELLAAQEELLQALKALEELKASDVAIIRETAGATVEAVREKLRLWGLTPEQIRQIEKRGKPSDHMTIYAPISGIVIHKNAQEGMYVDTGTRIYTIADLTQVWVKLDAYESDLVWLRYGQEVSIATEAYPGETFHGRVAFIDPVLNARTRTVKVRVNVPNPDGRLKPEMFVHGIVRAKVAASGRVMDPVLAGKWICPMHPEIVKTSAGRCDICEMPLVRTESLGYVSAVQDQTEPPLIIPASAPLITGKRAIVYVEVPDAPRPTFEGRQIVLGPRAGDYYIVRTGLKEGEFVVTQGNFKIDSALQIQAKPSMMTPEGGGGGGGHQHGGATPRKTSAGGKPKAAVPQAFRDSLREVVAAYRRVSQTVKAEQIEQIKAAFAGLGDAIEAVPMNLLSGHPHMMWMELSMLLRNDSVEGRDVKNLDEAQRLLATVTRHINRLQMQFGLTHAAEKTSRAGPFEVPEAFRSQLGRVFDAYVALQEALAADDFQRARQAAEATRQALTDVQMKLLAGGAHEAWMKQRPDLDKAIAEMTKAADLQSLRAGFALLSESLPVAIRAFGLHPPRSVYQLKCPMAFGGRGATWLQSDRDTRNPYFGAAMLKCGDVVDTIQPAKPVSTGVHQDD